MYNGEIVKLSGKVSNQVDLSIGFYKYVEKFTVNIYLEQIFVRRCRAQLVKLLFFLSGTLRKVRACP